MNDNQVLPLLDGLDEVAQEHRVECTEAINSFGEEHSSLVVCSRIKDYEALAVRLKFSGVVVIQPLTRDQVDDYLAESGPPLAGVRAALKADETLYELMDTPLMLSIAQMAYEGYPAGRVRTRQVALKNVGASSLPPTYRGCLSVLVGQGLRVDPPSTPESRP